MGMLALLCMLLTSTASHNPEEQRRGSALETLETAVPPRPPPTSFLAPRHPPDKAVSLFFRAPPCVAGEPSLLMVTATGLLSGCQYIVRVSFHDPSLRLCGSAERGYFFVADHLPMFEGLFGSAAQDRKLELWFPIPALGPGPHTCQVQIFDTSLSKRDMNAKDMDEALLAAMVWPLACRLLSHAKML